MLDGRTPLHVFDRGSMTGVKYRDEVLVPYVRLFRGAVGPKFILQDDNARPHRALLVDEFLESEDIRGMDWPARSPDLNPIEHVWDALGRAIATRNPPPRTIPEPKTTLLNVWDQLPQALQLVSSAAFVSDLQTPMSVTPEHASTDCRLGLLIELKFCIRTKYTPGALLPQDVRYNIIPTVQPCTMGFRHIVEKAVGENSQVQKIVSFPKREGEKETSGVNFNGKKTLSSLCLSAASLPQPTCGVSVNSEGETNGLTPPHKQRCLYQLKALKEPADSINTVMASAGRTSYYKGLFPVSSP
ncbi:Transposable element Tc3 transposase, partial [Stegodyphus mimosarum]